MADEDKYTGEDRRKVDLFAEARFRAMQEQLDRRIAGVKEETAKAISDVKADVAEMRSELQVNTDTTKRVEEGTLYVISLIQGARRGARVMAALGRAVGWVFQKIRRAAVWLAPLMAIGTAVWAFLHGKLPGGG